MSAPPVRALDRTRRMPWRDAPEPHVSVEAAARATAAAVERGPAGIYNVVDDNNAITNVRARNLLGWQP